MVRVQLLPHIRSIRAALETYRDMIDELERANWSGDITDASRRIAALNRIAAGRSTEELEHLSNCLATDDSIRS